MQHKKETDKEARIRKKQEKYISIVTDATGWDRDYAEEKIKRAKEVTGTSYEHYAVYRFWELSDEEQKTYFSKGDADKLNARYNTDPQIRRMFVNKDLFLANFEKYIGRPWLSTDGMTLEKFREKFGNSGKVIYKPRSLTGGHGVKVFEFDEAVIEDIYEIICALPVGVIEGYVDQHPEMKKLSLNSVNTIRVVTINTSENLPGVKKNRVNFVYAGVRMGQGDSVVDNLHSGGMMACINIETGVVETNASNFKNDVFVKHPDTGVVIKGFQIPFFKEVKKLVEEAGDNIPGYLGWDIAITEKGPIIIEVNTHPGADGLQQAYVPEKKGMRYVVEKYLAEPKSKVLPEVPYGTKISGITKEGIEFYWKKLERANGYYIFRAYKEDGPFEQIAVINKRNIGTYIDSEFDRSKKTVYYTLCSFLNNDDGTTVCSEKVAPQAAAFREELVLEREATYMYSGTTRSIRAFYGWGEVEDAQWQSDDESVATISPEGVINAVSSGECTLTCTSKSRGKYAKTKVVVDRKACEPLTEIKSRFSLNNENGIWENKNATKTNAAVIMMVGDMMCGKMQMKKQYTEEEGWNFNDSFEFVKEITAGADFSIGNLETLLASGWPYMLDESYIDNMNNCNATSRYLDAIRYGGFDAVVMANNHNCDGGKQAVLETIEQVDKYQFARTGLFCNEADKRFFLADINGIKVGFLAYISEGTGFNGKDKDWSKEDKDVLLNVFTKEKAARDIAECKAVGAEYVIVYMHWGNKNHRSVAKHQIADAQSVADAGADYIVGSNPHLVQVYDVITSEGGKKVPCAYSIGNFQANMNQVPGNRDSVIIRICLKKDENGNVYLSENNYIPCHTYTNFEEFYLTPVAVSRKFNKIVKKKNGKTFHNRIVDAIGGKIEEF